MDGIRLIQDTVQAIIDHIDEGEMGLINAGIPRKTAKDIAWMRRLVPEDREQAFIDWFYSILSPDKWTIVTDPEPRVRLKYEANYSRPHSVGGVARCIKGAMSKFVDRDMEPVIIASDAGYNGYKEAVALVNCIMSGENTYNAWSAFSKASHRYGRKALCATLLAGSDEWEETCEKIMRMGVL